MAATEGCWAFLLGVDGDLTPSEFMLQCAAIASGPPDSDALIWVWLNFTWRATVLLTLNEQKREELADPATREVFGCEALAMELIYNSWKDELKVTSPEQLDEACLGMWDRKTAEVYKSMKEVTHR